MPGYVYYIDPILKATEKNKYILSDIRTIDPGDTLTVDVREHEFEFIDPETSLYVHAFFHGVPVTAIEIFNYVEEGYGSGITLWFDWSMLNVLLHPGSYYRCERTVQVFKITNVGNSTALCKWIAYLPLRPRITYEIQG